MSIVYLVPSFLADEAKETIPHYILDAVRNCTVIFAENERTARRFLKSMDQSVVIDEFEWHAIHKAEAEQINNFKAAVKQDKNIAIISEAGCPGIADPGQILIAIAQELNCIVKPLVGPSSILLALMASGMNGQNFQFHGYLPIDNLERKKKIQALEAEANSKGTTQLFIETPYRNNQLLEALIQNCQPQTKLCIGVDITAPNEFIKTATIAYWKANKPELHKKLVVFLIGSK